jgi:hypothetical protein
MLQVIFSFFIWILIFGYFFGADAAFAFGLLLILSFVVGVFSLLEKLFK